MITNYFYENQIRDYQKQFAGIFLGMHVKTGKDGLGQETFMQVPVTIGNKDRVVAAIQAGHTQNRPFSLPTMSCYLQGIDLAPQRRKGISTIDRRVFMPQGGVFPDDLSVVQRLMPIPYDITMELSIYASNTDQLHQILEQILMIFDPIVQIQKNDSSFDWTKITHVELIGIANEENYPIGTDRRIINWTLTFNMPIYLSAPLELKHNIVKDIVIQLGNLDTMQLNEYDENGNLVPFGETFAMINVTSSI